MLPEGNWITRAPVLRRKITLLAKVQDEAGHGLYIYCGTETLGVDRAELVEQLLDGHRQVLEHLQLSDAHLGRHRRPSAGSSTARRSSTRPMLAKASYGPYARAMIRICKEENFHKRQGYEIMATLAAGTPGAEGDGAGRGESLVVAVAHDVRPAATRDSPNSDELLRWSVKRKSNDELRQRFVNLTVPQATGDRPRRLPDPDLKYDEATENWKFGAIDWDEFWRVVKGDGPCNRERLAARRKAHDEGEWVRDCRGGIRREAEAHLRPKPLDEDRTDEASGRDGRQPVAAVGGLPPAAEGRGRTNTRAASTRWTPSRRCRTRATSTRVAVRP